MSQDDPIGHVSARALSWASLAAGAAAAWMQVADMRSRAKLAQGAAAIRAAEVERSAKLARDSQWWQPMLDEKRYATSTVRDAGLAWASATAWRGYPPADHVARVAEGRLRYLRPDVMRVWDQYRAAGDDPIRAMRRVADIIERPPARPTSPERVALVMPRSSEEMVADSFPNPPDVHIDTGERAILLRAQKDAERFFVESMPGSWVPDELKRRRLTAAAQVWGVGYAPGSRTKWTCLVDHMHGKGYSDKELVAAGLASWKQDGTTVDRFRDRMMFPVRTAYGETVSFVGRKHKDNARERDPKYLNGSDSLIYHKGEQLPGVWEHREALAAGGRPVLVEGIADAMAVTEGTNGRYVGVTPSGIALTPGQVEVLKTVCDVGLRGVTVAFDGDEGGRLGALKAAAILHAAGLDTPQVVTLPAGQDPASMFAGAGRGVDLFAALEDSKPLADLVVDARLAEWPYELESIEERAKAARFCADTVAALPPVDVGRQVVRLSERLDLPVEGVNDYVLDAVTAPDLPKHSFVPKEMAAHREMGLVR